MPRPLRGPTGYPALEQGHRLGARIQHSLEHGKRFRDLLAARQGMGVRCGDLFLIRCRAVRLLEPTQRLTRLVKRHVDQVAQVVRIGGATRGTSQSARVSPTSRAMITERSEERR